jgi:hypothetical protein
MGIKKKRNLFFRFLKGFFEFSPLRSFLTFFNPLKYQTVLQSCTRNFAKKMLPLVWVIVGVNWVLRLIFYEANN